MSAFLSTITRPAITRTSGTFSRLFGARRHGIARYFVRRAAIARLREFDDAELRDIGLARSQIEQAVRVPSILGSRCAGARRRATEVEAETWN